MSLIRLLSVGRTLAAADQKPHRFRELGHGALPRFGPAADARRTARRQDVAQRGDDDSTAAEGNSKKQNEQTVMNIRTQQTGRPGEKDWLASLRRAMSAWLSCFLPTRRGAGRASKGGAVQQELRLDNVKVCRNDLAEADWEIVKQAKSGVRMAFVKKLATGGRPATRQAQTPVGQSVAERV